MDEEAFTQDEQFDGYYGIETSEEDIKPQDALAAYHTLWKIEESFRIIKSTLDIRPVYHWTPKRIEGHILLCFLSFYILRVMQYELKEKGLDIPIEKVRESLDEIRAVEIIDRNQVLSALAGFVGYFK